MASPTFNIVSWNTGGNQKLCELLSIISDDKPDIILLQEVKCNTNTLNTLVKKYKYQANVNNNQTDSNTLGTAFVWKEHLNVAVHTVQLCRLQILIVDEKLPILNVYGPSGNDQKEARKDFYGTELFYAIQTHNELGLPIIGGDFNCIISDDDTLANASNKKCQKLEELLNSFGYSDVFRILYPGVQEFTWFRPGASPSRIDRFYVPQQFVNDIVAVTHEPSQSDHHKLKFKFNFYGIDRSVPQASEREKGYWKLNTSILNDSDFQENFRDAWEELLKCESDYTDIAEWWDECAKPNIARFCRNYSSMLKKVRRDTKQFLIVCLDDAIKMGLWNDVAYYKSRIRQIIQQETMGFVIRSRHKQTIEEERGSIYHINREKKRGEKSNCNKIKIKKCEKVMENGVEKTVETVETTEDKDKVEEALLGFFEPLFSGHHGPNASGGDPINTGQPFVQDAEHLNDFLNLVSKLEDGQCEMLETPMDFKELEEIVKDCDQNKSPGLDGLSYEFYKKMFGIIGQKLVDIFNNILDRIRLTKTMAEGITKLLSKVLGIPFPDQLRPITLLNCDYKLLTKVLCQRVIPVLPSVIKSRQLCSVQEQNILFGINNLLSSIEYVNLKALSAYIVSYDLYKAYDRVFIPYLCQVLKAMGFGEKFISWIVMCHTDITTCFLLKFISDPIKVTFSLRQGDPWSMVLYVLYIEPLLLRLRNELDGIKIAMLDQKDEDFCDDINICSENENDLVKADKIICEFESVSGALLNRSKKSKIIGIGGWTDRTDWPIKWLSVEKQLKIFGYKFTPFYEDTIEACWQVLLSKFQETLNSWNSRMLSLLRLRAEVL